MHTLLDTVLFWAELFLVLIRGFTTHLGLGFLSIACKSSVTFEHFKTVLFGSTAVRINSNKLMERKPHIHTCMFQTAYLYKNILLYF